MTTRLSQSVRRFALGGALLAAAALAGCARPVGTVTGKVTTGSKVVKGGSITFVSTEGQPSMATTISEDGSYTLAKITAGNYKICVETLSVKGPPPPSPSAGAKPTPKAQVLDPDTKVPEGYHPSSAADMALAAARARGSKLYVPIPEKYTNSDTSELSYTVIGGDQTHDIELK